MTVATVTHDNATVEAPGLTEAQLRMELGLPEAAEEASTEESAGAETPAEKSAPPAVSVAPASAVPAPPKKKQSAQERIAELSGTVANKQQHIDTLTARLAALEKRLAEPKAEPTPELRPATGSAGSDAANDPEPDPADTTKYPDGQFDRKFLRDLSLWAGRQEAQKIAKASEERHQKEAAHQGVAAAMERVRVAGTKNHPDFEATLTKLADAGVQFSPVLTHLILTHDLGHELAYALASDLALGRRVSAIADPLLAGIEAQKIFSRLEAAASGSADETPDEPISSAKPPIQPVGSAPHTADTEPGDDASDDEWYRYHKARGTLPGTKRRTKK